MTGKLFVMATPLGNLGDLSVRAADVLRSVDVVAAEDTRRSRTLLNHVNARPRVVSYHAHSKVSRADELMETLGAGEAIALLTDAGTPSISDPGVGLVSRALEAGIEVVSVPGPSAVAAALSVSGLPADQFTFLGFLPRKGRDRARLLHAVAGSPWTVVIFEAPPRLVRLLEDLAEVCGGERQAVIARELTKLHEEVRAGTLAVLGGYYRQAGVKGEITVLVSSAPVAPHVVSEDTIQARARDLLADGMSRRDVAALLAEELDVSRKETYRVVTSL